MPGARLGFGCRKRQLRLEMVCHGNADGSHRQRRTQDAAVEVQLALYGGDSLRRRRGESDRHSRRVCGDDFRVDHRPVAQSKPGAVRDEVVIASKGKFPTGPGPNDGGLSRRHLSRAIDASLGWLGGGSHRLVPGPRLGSLDTDRRDLAGPRRRCQRGQDPLRSNVEFHGLAGVKSG